MTFTRYLAPLPTPYDLDECGTLTRSHFPAALSINVVDASLAVYLDAEPSQGQLDAWRTAVLAHIPSGVPKPWQNEATIRDAATQALATLRNVRTQAAALKTATFANNTTRDNAIRSCAQGLEIAADNLIRLGRLTLGQLDGTD